MASGSSVYQTITSKISGVEQEHKKAAQALRKTEAQIDTLVQEREQHFSDLAVFYLPEMDAKAVKDTIQELQKEVQRIYAQKLQRREQLEDLVANSENRQHESQESIREFDEKLEEKAARRDELEKTVAKELDQNPAYKKRHEEAKQAQAGLEQNRVRARTFNEEAAKNIKRYEGNKLFMYLVRREFGTDSYAVKGITGRLDQWVARLVNYRENKPKYDFLKMMPAAINAEIERQQQALDIVVERLQSIEEEASARLGLTKVLQEGEVLAEKRRRVTKEAEDEAANFARYAHEEHELNSTKGKYHQQALGRLKEYLTGSAIAELKRRAKETPDSRDDHLVDKIEGIDLEIKELKSRARKVQQEQAELSTRLQGLRQISSQYTNKNYESSRSYFGSGFDVNTLLIGYLAGRFSSTQVITNIDSSHHFRPRQTYSSSSSYSSHSSSSGGGFGGGGFSSGGSFGGGGFSTGGGF